MESSGKSKDFKVNNVMKYSAFLASLNPCLLQADLCAHEVVGKRGIEYVAAVERVVRVP